MADQKNEDERRRALLAVMYGAKSDTSCAIERLNRHIAHVSDLEISSTQCARYVFELNNELIHLNPLLKPYLLWVAKPSNQKLTMKNYCVT